MNNRFKHFISIFFPKKCISCGEIICVDKDICDICYAELPVIEKRCDICGNPKEYCFCTSRVFYFEKCICVFENSGTAKQSYYRYKLSGKPHYVGWFAKKIANEIKASYPDMDFDAVCAVPSSALSIMNRGFRHSELLASRVAGILGIPYIKDMLGAKGFRKPQHKSAAKERIENVRGKYYIKRRADGMKILLIDDIRTTGATLSECSHMLLLGGAQNVRCATLLATIYKKNKNKNGDINGN